MSGHFSGFTPEAMQSFGQDLATNYQRCSDFIAKTRHQTSAMLAGFQRELQDSGSQRRERAKGEADARRLFRSELRSDVHALVLRFELSRKEMAEELKELTSELKAACDAFRARPGRRGHVA